MMVPRRVFALVLLFAGQAADALTTAAPYQRMEDDSDSCCSDSSCSRPVKRVTGGCCGALVLGSVFACTAMKLWPVDFKNENDCGLSEFVSKFKQEFLAEHQHCEKVWRMEPWELLPAKNIHQKSMYSYVDESDSEARMNGSSALVFERHDACNRQGGFLAPVVRGAFGEGGRIGAQNWCPGMQGFQNASCLFTESSNCSLVPGVGTMDEKDFAKHIREETGNLIQTRWLVDGCTGGGQNPWGPWDPRHGLWDPKNDEDVCGYFLGKDWKGCDGDLDCIAVMGYTTGARYLQMRDASRYSNLPLLAAYGAWDHRLLRMMSATVPTVTGAGMVQPVRNTGGKTQVFYSGHAYPKEFNLELIFALNQDITIPGFLSTSPDREIASKFELGEIIWAHGRDQTAMLQLNFNTDNLVTECSSSSSSGDKLCMYPLDISGLQTGYANQRERIFPMFTTVRPVRIEKDEKNLGNWFIELDVVGMPYVGMFSSRKA